MGIVQILAIDLFQRLDLCLGSLYPHPNSGPFLDWPRAGLGARAQRLDHSRDYPARIAKWTGGLGDLRGIVKT